MRFIEPRSLTPSSVTAACVAVMSLGLCVLSPWWYGAATWEAQSYIFIAGIALGISMAVHGAITYAMQEERWAPGVISWFFVGLGLYALLQAQPLFSWESGSLWVPPSVSIQRWALGLADPPSAVASELIQVGEQAEPSATIACDGLSEIPDEDRSLAISVEPSTTRAAASSLWMCGLLIWVGSSIFAKERWYPVLLLVLTTVGVAVAFTGILATYSQPVRAWTGIQSPGAFATFVSKNSAGAYFNVVIAAALGLVLWTVQKSGTFRNQPIRHEKHWSLQRRFKTQMMTWIGGLDALQIAACLSLVVLSSALLLSLSRGAVMAGCAGLLAAMILTFSVKRTAATLLGVAVIGIMATAFIVVFQMDERIVTRLESLGDIDVTSESTAGRLYIWGVSLEASAFYRWLGSGLGTFHLASLPFHRPSFSGWYYHAESIFAETMVTLGWTGLVASGIAWVVVFLTIRRIYVSERFRRYVPMQIAGLYLLISQTVHGVVDFAIILPGVHLPAALLLGAALGASRESFAVVEKLRQKTSRSGLQGKHPSLPSHEARLWGPAINALLFSLAVMAALQFSRQSVNELAAAEKLERKFQREDKLPIPERSEDRLVQVIDRAIDDRVSLHQSPQLMRLIADSLCFDGQMQLWLKRPTTVDAKAYWNESSPFVVRVALDRIDGPVLEKWKAEMGGEARWEELRKANSYYCRAQAKSPFDWNALWGRITTSVDCHVEQLNRLAPVVHRVCRHLPQRLTSVSILFNDQLSAQERQRIWLDALRTSPGASIGIGRVMATQFSDGEVPIEMFPDQAYYLRKLALEVFGKERFPITYHALLRRSLDAVDQLDLAEEKRAALSADIARDLGDVAAEIQSLEAYVQRRPNDAAMLLRLIPLLIQQEQWTAAESALRRLKQAKSDHTSISFYTELIQKRGER